MIGVGISVVLAEAPRSCGVSSLAGNLAVTKGHVSRFAAAASSVPRRAHAWTGLRNSKQAAWARRVAQKHGAFGCAGERKPGGAVEHTHQRPAAAERDQRREWLICGRRLHNERAHVAGRPPAPGVGGALCAALPGESIRQQ